MAVHSYLRVSTLEQTVENQRMAINAMYATDYWYAEEGVSGSVDALDRPQFALMMSKVKEGDTVIVTALDRLGRNAADILNTTEEFTKMNVKVIVLNMGNMDITSMYGTVFAQIMGAMAQLERAQIRQRVNQGLARTKAEGTILGRPLSIRPETLRELCVYRECKTLKGLSAEYGIDQMTIHRNIKKWEGKMEEYSELWNKQQAQIESNKAA